MRVKGLARRFESSGLQSAIAIYFLLFALRFYEWDVYLMGVRHWSLLQLVTWEIGVDSWKQKYFLLL